MRLRAHRLAKIDRDCSVPRRQVTGHSDRHVRLFNGDTDVSARMIVPTPDQDPRLELEGKFLLRTWPSIPLDAVPHEMIHKDP